MDSVVSFSFMLLAHMAQDSLRRTEFVDTVTGSPTIHTVGSTTADYVHTATHLTWAVPVMEKEEKQEDCGGCSEGVVGYWGARPGCVAYLVYICN